MPVASAGLVRDFPPVPQISKSFFHGATVLFFFWQRDCPPIRLANTLGAQGLRRWFAVSLNFQPANAFSTG